MNKEINETKNQIIGSALTIINEWERSDRNDWIIEEAIENIAGYYGELQRLESFTTNDSRQTKIVKAIHEVARHPFMAAVILQACENYLIWWENIPQEQKEEDFKKSMIGLGAWQHGIDDMRKMLEEE